MNINDIKSEKTEKNPFLGVVFSSIIYFFLFPNNYFLFMGKELNNMIYYLTSEPDIKNTLFFILTFPIYWGPLFLLISFCIMWVRFIQKKYDKSRFHCRITLLGPLVYLGYIVLLIYVNF